MKEFIIRLVENFLCSIYVIKLHVGIRIGMQKLNAIIATININMPLKECKSDYSVITFFRLDI